MLELFLWKTNDRRSTSVFDTFLLCQLLHSCTVLKWLPLLLCVFIFGCSIDGVLTTSFNMYAQIWYVAPLAPSNYQLDIWFGDLIKWHLLGHSTSFACWPICQWVRNVSLGWLFHSTMLTINDWLTLMVSIYKHPISYLMT